jgi:exosortase/archaeosortase family protein
LKQNLAYIDWLRYSILHTGKALCKLIGVKCHIENIYFIRLDDKSSGLRMVYRCVGYGVMSFWAAFVLANKSRLVKKIYWVLLGWIVIWIINCIRVVLLLTALEKNWSVNKYVDHHALFNIVAYGFIFLLIFTYLYLDNPSNKRLSD